MTKKLQAQIKRYAKQDIELVYRHGKVTVTETKLGTLTFSLNSDGETITVYPLHSTGRMDEVVFQYRLSKKEAISYLMNAFEVVGE
jgi:endonuclease/exonuclease/phosphatase (EEP) superfamily protein YafD